MIKNEFPEYRVAEDAHVWIGYSASGAKFKYISDMPTRYRMPQSASRLASRQREG